MIHTWWRVVLGGAVAVIPVGGDAICGRQQPVRGRGRVRDQRLAPEDVEVQLPRPCHLLFAQGRASPIKIWNVGRGGGEGGLSWFSPFNTSAVDHWPAPFKPLETEQCRERVWPAGAVSGVNGYLSHRIRPGGGVKPCRIYSSGSDSQPPIDRRLSSSATASSPRQS